MSALDTTAGGNAIIALLGSILSISHVQWGVPESASTRLSAYVTVGSQSPERKTSATVVRWTRYMVLLAYRVDNNEQSAEQALAAAVEGIQAAIQNDLTLGSVAADAEIDLGLADDPQYRMTAGREYREYPIIIALKQYGSYNIEPGG